MRYFPSKLDSFLFGMLVGIGYKVIYGKTVLETIQESYNKNNIEIKFKKT